MAETGRQVLGVGEESHGLRLDRFLKKHFPRLPHGLVYKLGRRRQITVNRRRAKPATRVQRGDQVEVWEDLSRFALAPDHALRVAEQVRASPSFRRRFRVLHEDDSIVVLDKPGGLVVHPGPHHHRGDTLLDLLRVYLPEAFADGSPFRPAFVHRLDRGTSGVIVAAKTRDRARELERALRQGKARKVYLALAHGRLRGQEGTMTFAIAKTETPSRVTRFHGVPCRGPEHRRSAATGPAPRSALTRYRVEQRFAKATLLRLEPESGRTHQIRVHLATLGHPVVGDGDYGNKDVNRHYRERFALRRVFLHAAELALPDPRRGTRTFRAPLPEDLARVLEGLTP